MFSRPQVRGSTLSAALQAAKELNLGEKVKNRRMFPVTHRTMVGRQKTHPIDPLHVFNKGIDSFLTLTLLNSIQIHI